MNVEDLLERIEEVLDNGQKVAFSSKIVVDIEEIRNCVDEIRANMPEEVRQARNIVSDRNAIIGDANAVAEETVAKANEKARETVNKANAKAKEYILTSEERAKANVAEAEEKAATIVARPGTSEHHCGFAIDFNETNTSFEKSNAYKWMLNNAADYGFILRYPEDKQDITGVIYEPWHWRFVGIDVAKDINSKNMCLEEYIEEINNKGSAKE